MVKTAGTAPKCYSEMSVDNRCGILNEGCYFPADSQHTSCKLCRRADEAGIAYDAGHSLPRTGASECYCMLHAEQHGSSLSGCAA